MNRHEQFLFAYIIINLLRMIASAIVGTHGFHSEKTLDAFMQESDRIKVLESRLLTEFPDTGFGKK